MTNDTKLIKSSCEKIIGNLIKQIIIKNSNSEIIFKYIKNNSIIFGNFNIVIQNILGARLNTIIDWNSDDTRADLIIYKEGLLKDLYSPKVEFWIPNNGEKNFVFESKENFQTYIQLLKINDDKVIELKKKLVIIDLKDF